MTGFRLGIVLCSVLSMASAFSHSHTWLQTQPSSGVTRHCVRKSPSCGVIQLRAQDRGRGQVSEAMRKKLSSESDAPLRLPLLYASAVLFGKGITDSIITVLKSVSGVSKEPLGDHAAMFVLDAVCMVAGIALALRVSEAWSGCLYNPTTWKMGSPWFLQKRATNASERELPRESDEMPSAGQDGSS